MGRGDSASGGSAIESTTATFWLSASCFKPWVCRSCGCKKHRVGGSLRCLFRPCLWRGDHPEVDPSVSIFRSTGRWLHPGGLYGDQHDRRYFQPSVDRLVFCPLRELPSCLGCHGLCKSGSRSREPKTQNTAAKRAGITSGACLAAMSLNCLSDAEHVRGEDDLNHSLRTVLAPRAAMPAFFRVFQESAYSSVRSESEPHLSQSCLEGIPF